MRWGDDSLDRMPSGTGSSLSGPEVDRFMREAGEKGMPYQQVIRLLPRVQERPTALATGHAGDVYLCHPFLVPAASWPHRGTAQTAVRLGLGLDGLTRARGEGRTSRPP